MSKYDPLWEYVEKQGADTCQLSYQEIQSVLGFPIDHSFLTFKKELLAYGYQVGKISIKGQMISFERTK